MAAGAIALAIAAAIASKLSGSKAEKDLAKEAKKTRQLTVGAQAKERINKIMAEGKARKARRKAKQKELVSRFKPVKNKLRSLMKQED